MPGDYEKWYEHDKSLAMNFMVVYSLHVLYVYVCGGTTECANMAQSRNV